MVSLESCSVRGSRSDPPQIDVDDSVLATSHVVLAPQSSPFVARTPDLIPAAKSTGSDLFRLTLVRI
jgi:hypothetical protein